MQNLYLQELWSLLEFMMPDIFATGDVDLKKLLNAEDSDLIARIKSILGPFILRRLKSDVMQQLVPKIQHVSFIIGPNLFLRRFGMFHSGLYQNLKTFHHLLVLKLQVRYVSMGNEQSKAYKNAINEYRAASQARIMKSSIGTSKNAVGSLPRRQISNYFMQFRKVESVPLLNISPIIFLFLILISCFSQIANHPLLVRHIYSDEDVVRFAKMLYPKGVFGFECNLERVIQQIKNYNDFEIHRVTVVPISSLLL